MIVLLKRFDTLIVRLDDLLRTLPNLPMVAKVEMGVIHIFVDTDLLRYFHDTIDNLHRPPRNAVRLRFTNAGLCHSFTGNMESYLQIVHSQASDDLRPSKPLMHDTCTGWSKKTVPQF